MSTETKRPSLQELEDRARRLRKHIIRMTTEAGSGHPTSSLSAVEVVAALYFGGLMRYDAKRPDWPERDRFILSKGHAAPVLYAALAEAGYFPADDLMTLRKLGSPLEGHPNMRRLPGVEASTGSLGQGLSIGIGHALASRLDGHNARVFVLIGDGEIGEGQVWEAFASASKYRLGNLTAVLDQNGYQQTGPTAEVLDMQPVDRKIEAFGWHVQTIDGNNMQAVLEAFDNAREAEDRPSAIISRTQKGFGILPVLEEAGDANFHGKALPPDVAEKALKLLAGA